MNEYLLAYFLLFGPALTEEEYRPFFWIVDRDALSALLISHEIIDTSQANQFHYEYCFGTDILNMRQTISIMKDYPPVSDRNMFMHLDNKHLLECMTFNRKYCEHLQQQRVIHWNKAWFDDALIETNRLHYIYQRLYYITHRDMLVPQLRQALYELKQDVGDHYYGFQLPPHVPVWRFQSID